MNNKKHGQRRKRYLQPIGLIFYCFLLILLNELANKQMIINNLKNAKKIIDKNNRSMGNAQNRRQASGIRRQIWLCPMSFVGGGWRVKPAMTIRGTHHNEENLASSKLAGYFPDFPRIPFNELHATCSISGLPKMKKKFPVITGKTGQNDQKRHQESGGRPPSGLLSNVGGIRSGRPHYVLIPIGTSLAITAYCWHSHFKQKILTLYCLFK